MSEKISASLASELRSFDKKELNETKTSENVVTPVTGRLLVFWKKLTVILECAREKVLAQVNAFAGGLEHVETIEKNTLPSVEDLKSCQWEY